MNESNIPEADVETVSNRAGVSKQKARRALATVSNPEIDLAQAIRLVSDDSSSEAFGFSEEDVRIVVSRSDVSPQTAIRALQEADGYLATAISYLDSNKRSTKARGEETTTDSNTGETKRYINPSESDGDTQVYIPEDGADSKKNSESSSFCTWCGADLSDHTVGMYCPKCGEEL